MTADEAYQEALRRIAEADRTNADLLDLGDLPLDRLPHELGQLSRLRVLSLGEKPRFYSKGMIWESRLSHVKLTDLSSLRTLPNLRVLNLCKADVSDIRQATRKGPKA